MKKFNKSKIALFAALVSTVNVNCNYEAKAMNSKTFDFAAGAMSSISSSLAFGSSNPAWLIPALVMPIALVIGGVLLDQKLERDKVATTIISSLKSKGQLENIKKILAISKLTFEEVFRKNPQNFVGEKVKLGVDFDVKKVAALGSQNPQDSVQIVRALGQILVLKKMFGSVQINEQLRDQVSTCNAALFINYAVLISTLKSDMCMPLKLDKANIPISVDFIRSKKNPNDNKENLSVICSINFVSSKFDYSDRHKICIRMSDKFELLVDGSSYDIDELSKKLG